jgi:hypothetical protein
MTTSSFRVTSALCTPTRYLLEDHGAWRSSHRLCIPACYAICYSIRPRRYDRTHTAYHYITSSKQATIILLQLPRKREDIDEKGYNSISWPQLLREGGARTLAGFE